MAKNGYQRTPWGYDGTRLTSRRLGDVLPFVLRRVGQRYRDRSDLIIAAWPSLVGSTVAGMTEAVSFNEAVLTVRVKNSTLHSLLCGRDKPKILRALREKFPGTPIKTILFRVG